MLRHILHSFITYSGDDTLALVASVDVPTATILGVSNGGVWLGASYARKIVRKHGLDADHMMLAIESISTAPIYLDKHRRVTAIGRDLMGRPYIVGLKPDENRILISTIHRSEERQLRRLRRNGVVIRK